MRKVLAGVLGALVSAAAFAQTTAAPEQIVSNLNTYFTGTLQPIIIGAAVAITTLFLSVRLAKKGGRAAV